MKKSCTELMKELKSLKTQISDTLNRIQSDTYVPVNEEMKPYFEKDFNYDELMTKLDELYAREAQIKAALNEYNNTHKVQGYHLTIAQALVKLAQLKRKVVMLTIASNRPQYIAGNKEECFKMNLCPIEKVKVQLMELQTEHTRLQIALDRTNLLSEVDC